MHLLTSADAGRNANTHEVLEGDEDGDKDDKALPHSGNPSTLPVVEVTEPGSVEQGVDIQPRPNHCHQTHEANLSNECLGMGFGGGLSLFLFILPFCLFFMAGKTDKSK